MQIYYASQSFYPHIGGVSTYLLNLCKELSKKGNNVVEVHLRPSGEHYADHLEGIEVHRVPRDPIKTDIMKEYSKFKEAVYKECHYNAEEFDKNPEEMEGFKEFNIVNEYFGEELRNLLENKPADVVHIHDFQLLYAYKYIPRGMPLILTWHIPFNENMSIPLKNFLIKHMREYDKVVFSSEDYIRTVIDAGLPKEKVELIHPIANTNLFKLMDVDKKEIRRKYNIPENDKIIMSVQRVDPKSGHKQLIDAMPKILEKVPDAKLVFVGGDSLSNKLSDSRAQLKQSIMDRIDELGLKDKVIFTGTIDYNELPKLYNSVDMVALCSKNEGFGLSITEAMSCKNAIVGTNVGGIPIQVKDGYNGFIVEVGDVEKTSESILKILTDDDLRAEMEKNSLKMVDDNFTIDVGVQKHTELYNSLIRKKDSMKKLEFIPEHNVKAMAFDLDRTLIDKPAKEDFDENDFDEDLFKELAATGKDLLLVTGRSFEFVQKIAERFPIWKAVVAENGSIIYFPEKKQKIVIDSEYAKQAREEINKMNLIGSYIGKVMISCRRIDEDLIKENLESIRSNLNFVANVDELMILPFEVNKGQGLKIAQINLGIDPDKTIIVGDGENDIDMYLNPGMKIALKNSLPELKKMSMQVMDFPSTKGIRQMIGLLKQ